MSKKKRARQRRKTGPIVAAVLVIATVFIGGLVILSRRSVTDPGAALRDSETALSISAHVGEPAPEFTAIDADGRPYTVTPGDGRPKAIVFYMGFG